MSAACSSAVLTQAGSVSRSNTYLCEHLLRPETLNADSFGRLSSLALDGHIYAQPLYIPRSQFDGSHDVAFLASMHNTVYAIDVSNAHKPSILWQRNLGPSIPIRIYEPWLDIKVEIGVLAAPAIDLERRLIYLTSHQYSESRVKHFLFALSLDDGSLHGGSGTEIMADSPGSGEGNSNGRLVYDPHQNLMRPALTLVGEQYVVWATGSIMDARPYHGTVMAYRRDTMKLHAVWVATPNSAGGGIWQSAAGLVVDPTGAVVVVVGNGYGADPEKGELVQSVVRLQLDSQGFKVLDWATPSKWSEWNDEDSDMCTACAIIPGTKQCIVGSKDAHLYRFNLEDMGHVNDTQVIDVTDPDQPKAAVVDGKSKVAARLPRLSRDAASAPDPTLSARAHIHGTPVAWSSASADKGTIIFVGAEKSHIQARRWLAEKTSIEEQPFARSDVRAEQGSMPGAMLSLSSTPDGNHGLLVAAMVAPGGGDANHVLTPGVIRVFDALTLREIYNTLNHTDPSTGAPTDSTDQFAKFAVVTIADGMMLVPSFGTADGKVAGGVHILGMRDRPTDGSGAARLDSGAAPAGVGSSSAGGVGGDAPVVVGDGGATSAAMRTAPAPSVCLTLLLLCTILALLSRRWTR